MRRTAASCSATSVSGSARRTNPSAGTDALVTGAATYSMSALTVVL